MSKRREQSGLHCPPCKVDSIRRDWPLRTSSHHQECFPSNEHCFTRHCGTRTSSSRGLKLHVSSKLGCKQALVRVNRRSFGVKLRSCGGGGSLGGENSYACHTSLVGLISRVESNLVEPCPAFHIKNGYHCVGWRREISSKQDPLASFKESIPSHRLSQSPQSEVAWLCRLRRAPFRDHPVFKRAAVADKRCPQRISNPSCYS